MQNSILFMTVLIFLSGIVGFSILVGAVDRWCKRIRDDIKTLRSGRSNLPQNDHDEEYLDRSDVTAEVIRDHATSDGF